MEKILRYFATYIYNNFYNYKVRNKKIPYIGKNIKEHLIIILYPAILPIIFITIIFIMVILGIKWS